jgi:hypothetical protein
VDLQITGRVVRILPEQSGEGRNGPWRKREFILETDGNYPKQICMVQWGDAIDQAGLQEGETVTAYIDIQSREYNERWYTDVKAWRIDRPRADAAPDLPEFAGGEPWPDDEPADAGSGDDDLPF